MTNLKYKNKLGRYVIYIIHNCIILSAEERRKEKFYFWNVIIALTYRPVSWCSLKSAW